MQTSADWVHYVLPDGPEHVHGQCRPAVVVHRWPDGTANLLVFRDGTNDGPLGLVQWVTSVTPSDRHEFGTWHRADTHEDGEGEA